MPQDRKFDIRLEDIRTPAGFSIANYAFESSPSTSPPDRVENYLNSRTTDKTFFSYVNGTAVAKTAITEMHLNVRGKVMPMGGISGVATMPSARRGGHVRQLMDRAIQEMYESGQAVSTLYPFKASYYEKFGYASWQIPLWLRSSPAAFAPYLDAPKHGIVTQRLLEEGLEDFFTIREEMQARVHGFSTFSRERTKGHAREHPSWLATVHEDDHITGAITWRTEIDKGTMPVFSFWALNENARYHLFDFLGRHEDHIKEIRMPLMPGMEPHLWTGQNDSFTILSNEEHAWNAPMGRVIDINGLGGIGAGDGMAAITISDPQCPWNEGTWNLTGSAGELHVERGGTSGGTITINALAALVFSGIDPALFPIRGWGNVDPTTAENLRKLFPPITPLIQEQF